MAYNNQEEFPLPAGKNSTRKSAELLPRYFRTATNNKFLSSTLDQMLQPGVAEKLNGYVGRKTAKAYSSTDNYLGDVSTLRENYQLEPACVIKDDIDNVTFYKDYNDYVNQISAFGGNTANHSRLNAQESYAWNPHIDWDKFVNFREYYWLPNGPQTIEISGQSEVVSSTISVTSADNDNNKAFIFGSTGQTQNPTFTLYRGQTYTFDINTPDLPFSIKTKRTLDSEFLYTPASASSVNVGTILVTITDETPDSLYYVAENDINTGGQILIKDISENSEIDVELEIVGKKYYTTSNGILLSNGMKVKFGGIVTPEEYANNEYYVEGVGTSIKLINEKNIEIPAAYSDDSLLPFDSEGFDRVPYSNASAYASSKDYIGINRASLDGNPWTRYNKWFHKSVIEQSASINNQEVSVDQLQRATRPIIEFEAGLKLFKFGNTTKENIDLIDTYTKDVFSTINGQIGYNIDGVDVTDGMRILFTADTDLLVQNKIYQAEFITHNGVRQIALVETEDTAPLDGEVVLVEKGNAYKGKMFYFENNTWKTAQEKTSTNQQPMFDIFDSNDISYADTSYYDASTFTGTSIFSYAIGDGTADTELGFALSYRSIENVGDIVFDFNLLKDTATYQENNTSKTLNIDTGVLKKYSSASTFEYVNGWTLAANESNQRVVTQHVIDNTTAGSEIKIDVYNNSGLLNDLTVTVLLNNALMIQDSDYTISVANNNAYINFVNPLVANDIVILKTRSSAVKNDNGYYEFPQNLEKNPKNQNITTFTLGEVNDHVYSIVDDLTTFNGTVNGSNNLRDLGNITPYGTKFVQHSGPVNLPLYHITNKDANIIKSLKFARAEYAKFKRKFLQIAFTLGVDTTPKRHVDLIFNELNISKTNTMPFYFSDMMPYGETTTTIHTLTDANNNYFALNSVFALNELSASAVLVYLNDTQLIYDRDYTFNTDGFCIVTADLAVNDIVTIYEYESTDGSFIPPTPTKLGLYPKFIPSIFVDNTYSEPQTVIQGHDGSITIAYGDYRDDLILELETRIYNNIKQEYNTSIFDIHTCVGGVYRDTNISKSDINTPMLSDFVEWNQRAGTLDYTTSQFYDNTNPFTFNYSSMTGPTGNVLPGFWRAMYIDAYDTDRPHTHPWEMLGFTIKPDWWEEQYGPAPYTKDNLVMWTDIASGNIREPNVPLVVNKKYIRTTLLNHLPVDSSGNLLDPLTSGYAKDYVSVYTKSPFKFGDSAPTETAWRKSSEYPFSLITSLVLTQPAKLLGTCFDISRISRNLVGQLVYSESQRAIQTSDIVFPNTSADSARTLTAGLVNYIADYMISDITTSYKTYKENVTSITNQMGIKLAGFTDKSKFKLILDSRTPLNQGNVFIPEENYNIFLNSSSPVDVVTYSGVVIEKQTSGFAISGYDTSVPTFNYFKPIPQDADVVINIGGISKSTVEWMQNVTYQVNTIVKYKSQYYTVKTAHTSDTAFDATYYTKLTSLPFEGGINAYMRNKFEATATTIPYGTVFETAQDVVDFLLGYGSYLSSLGFIFDYYNSDVSSVEDWRYSTKEFMFWTTQSWAEGSVLAVSPGATQLKLYYPNTVVDNIFDNFYNYSVLSANGEKINEEFISINRATENEFVITTEKSTNGLFNVRLPLIQKEHVVLIDNKTVFGDIIYDMEPGYRQERIKVQGYRSDAWNGGFNIAGFIYNDVNITSWSEWTDYDIGAVVKYKEFYYVAIAKVSGTETFDNSLWSRLSEKPESKLNTNFDYKVNQFTDFYDLDSDNFDIGQQKIAQHLIGYQNRQYLENIITDDVSQYKFYQGYIRDKGTRNAIDKLFDSLSSADKDSIDFYEEWAVKKGQYGASTGFEEIEYKLDESEFKLNPQPVELVQTVPENATDLIYRLRPFETYLKSTNYDHNPFPTYKPHSEYIKTAGYVSVNDVPTSVLTDDEILDLNIGEFTNGDYIWIGKYGQSWDVKQHVVTDVTVQTVVTEDTIATITLSESLYITENDIVGILNTTEDVDGFYRVLSVNSNTIVVDNTSEILTDDVADGTMTVLVTNRVAELKDVNSISQAYTSINDLIWIDDIGSTNWNVLKHTPVYTQHPIITNPELNDSVVDFSKALAASVDNTLVAVGTPDDSNGKVYLYTRPTNRADLTFSSTLAPSALLTGNLNPMKFGDTVAITSDNSFIAVGAPSALKVNTDFKGLYDESALYNKQDKVLHNNELYSARSYIMGTTEFEVETFNAYAFYANTLDPAEVNLLQLGNYNLPGVVTDHMLVRAPTDMWNGSADGDYIDLEWNTISASNGSTTAVEPFEDVSQITSEFITDTHTIIKKVEYVMEIPSYFFTPAVNDIVKTSTGSGTVVYVKQSDGSAVVYINNVYGVFTNTGTLLTANDNEIGKYIINYYSFSDVFSGYWMISTPTYTTPSEFVDAGKGLIYKDVVESLSEDLNYYQNMVNLKVDNKSNLNEQTMFITQLTYSGNAYENDPSVEYTIFESDKIVVRGPVNGPEINPEFDSLGVWVNNLTYDISIHGFGSINPNNVYENVELWDGYIDLEFNVFKDLDETDPEDGTPYEPLIGDIVYDITTNATAEVTYYQRRSKDVRVYVKNVTGNWSAGDNWNNTSKIGIKNYNQGNDRPIGDILATSLKNDIIGSLYVLTTSENFSVPGEDIIDEEYWIYETDTVTKTANEITEPSDDNLDWIKIYNIPVTDTDVVDDGYVSSGFISIYKKLSTQDYIPEISLAVPYVAEENENFGKKVQFASNNSVTTLFAASDKQLYIFKNGETDTETYNWNLTLTPSSTIVEDVIDFDVSDSGENLIILTEDAGAKQILVYTIIDNVYTHVSTITDSSSSTFGQSISISSNGTQLAVSDTFNSFDDNTGSDKGKVSIYSLENIVIPDVVQTLTRPDNNIIENFGYKVSFDGTQLAVTSINETSGVVYIYQNINDTLVYAQELALDYEVELFGKNLTVNSNHVYVGLPNETQNTSQGILVEYSRPTGSSTWNVHSAQVDPVNVDKIKSAFLYNTVTNKIVTTLDVIDPVQGKIASIAEQEISFKTYYDPATYSSSTAENVIIESTAAWESSYVGKVWWDLSAAKFYNAYQGSTIYQTNYWNTLFPGTSIDVYEWVESSLLPSEWDEIADTEEGLSQGISGISKYGDTAYVENRKYNTTTGVFKSVYYFWVKNKTTVPQKEWRTISAASVAALIANPETQGYKFAVLNASNKFVLFNCGNLLSDKDIAVNFSYWTIDNKEQNIHNEYQLITLDDSTSLPNADIQLKWFDSLIGYDSYNRIVPDPNLSPKQKYGTLFKPRQSWFINRTEALKQFIERVNRVLINNLIVDEFDISPLLAEDTAPTTISRLYDVSIDSDAELEYVGTSTIIQAELTPVVENGVITSVNISNSGKGYLVEPTYQIIGTGSGAELSFELDLLGKIKSVTVKQGGKNYSSDTRIAVRNFSVLVNVDSQVNNKWAIYERQDSAWVRSLTQQYNLSPFWNYTDWYDTGYNSFTTVDYYISESYKLTSLDTIIGDIIKIGTVGTGGWLLLERIAQTGNEDYTLDYKTIGRENGTIQFTDLLYNTSSSLVGYSTASYDTQFFDRESVTEARIILEAIRDNLFVDELAVEFNKLFFASLRYVFSEQPFVDWAFKTSFIKAKHNVGNLEQHVNFQNDNLSNYEDYINEVKPYKTKIREYVSSYENLENNNSVISDFDLAPRYNTTTKQIEPVIVTVQNNTISANNVDLTTYPRKHWIDNVGYQLTELVLSNTGSGYLSTPSITITNGGGTGATAKAYVSSGKIVKIEVLTAGTGYLSAPDVIINGELSDSGTPAIAAAVIGNGVVRTMNIKFKFDRVTGNFYITDLAETETFTGSGNNTTFKLKWPMDIKSNNTTILINGIEALSQEYTTSNIDNFDKDYTRQIGNIEFDTPPALNATIEIRYTKSTELLTAQDRINFLYNPTTGMIGKDVAQLIDGIDYGGVEVKSFDFGTGTGWDSDAWFSTTWDTYDTTFEDIIVTLSSAATEIELSTSLEEGIVYNIYKNGTRLDDVNFDNEDHETNPITNPNAVCNSITGNGQTTISLSDLNITDNKRADVIIIRKTTSDGSFLPDDSTYDTQISGGNIAYSTATGLNAEDIVIDGDGFVTPTTSKGPEELVPGQILDTLDIRVYDRAGPGASNITSQVYTTDGVTTVYKLESLPVTADSLIVTIDRTKISSDNYVINYNTSELILNTAPDSLKLLNIVVLGLSATNVISIETITLDTETTSVITNVTDEEDLSAIAFVNGTLTPITVTDNNGLVELEFASSIAADSVVTYSIVREAIDDNFSFVNTETIIADGSNSSYTLVSTPANKVPSTPNVVVRVDDVILHAGYNKQFEISDTSEYFLDTWQQPSISLQPTDVEVYLNDVKLELSVSWRWDVYNSSVVLFKGVGADGDILKVYVTTDTTYTIEDNIITFASTPDENSVIEVTQFTNHDIQDIERIKYDVVSRAALTLGTQDYTEYHNLTTGLIKLRSTATMSQYVWVILNGIQLVPNVDYILTDNKEYVKISTSIKEDDVVEIIHFANAKVTDKFGFRQFKDMLNRVHYKRLPVNSNYELAENLNYYDLRIELNDASGLPTPNKSRNIPGVLFINGERIEYMVKSGNTLRQLRRGTLGTGIPTVHTVGTEVINQSLTETVPYTDETVTTIIETTDSETTTFTLDFDATTMVDSYEATTGIRLNESVFFEVFVAGKRLRKNSISMFDNTVAQDSPEGDVILPAEFTANGTELTLLTAPEIGQKIIVVRRVGKTWSDSGTELRYANNKISKFICKKTGR